MRIILQIILLSVICLFGCGKSVSPEPQSFSLKMKRNNCNGTCPVYILTVESSGTVMFEGIKYTQTIGKTESKLSNERVKELIAEINKANFFSLQDDYSFNSKNCSAPATDMPSINITIKFDETEKAVNHYAGCFVKSGFSEKNALQPLTDLENKIDEIVETKRWIGERK